MHRRTGFTLIEVLASMAILLILMLALVRMFDEASAAMRKGTTSVSRSAAARAALELITRDLEGAVIDRRFQFYKEANAEDNGNHGAGFDEFYMVTLGDAGDGRSYQLVRYYVDIYTATNAGVKYRGFKLMRGTVDTDVVQKSTGIDVLSTSKPWGWWNQVNKASPPFGIWNNVRVADNVVRFDMYVHNDNGHLIQSGGGWKLTNAYYDSGRECALSKEPVSIPASSTYASNTPPAFFDIYLQITSDDAMKRGGLDLLSGELPWDDDLQKEGRSLLYRESFLLTTRIHPSAASAQMAHPSQY